MPIPDIHHCPGTLAPGYTTYSSACLRRVFNGHKVSHILPYLTPATDKKTAETFLENQKRMSISGVQEKFSVLLEKNKLRLTEQGERGAYILKPAPVLNSSTGKLDYPDQLPANEHLTMQIAKQVFGIETAENALVFFKNGEAAYITKRFDVNAEGGKLAKEDFASLAGLTPQKDGEHYKYSGCYYDLFPTLKKYSLIYPIEAPKLFRLMIFNYLFSNGDAHHKNFSLLETLQGDYRLSPAYDLLNTHLHVDDSVFALVDGLLPINYAVGNIRAQLIYLGIEAEIPEKQVNLILKTMISKQDKVQTLIQASFLSPEFKETYTRHYFDRLQKLNTE